MRILFICPINSFCFLDFIFHSLIYSVRVYVYINKYISTHIIRYFEKKYEKPEGCK